MRKSITQEFDFGCGIACFAFVLNVTYREAEILLGPEQSKSIRFWVKDLNNALNKSGQLYRSMYVTPKVRKLIYKDGAIVLIRRSKKYKAGHYLIRYKDYWMDPWINLPSNNDIKQAKSGFRRRLPGNPMYVLLPQ